MPIGTLLRHAREEAGLTAAEISERTRIQLYKIEALENGDFVHLPDGIYLDGIVRAYARELALEPEPLIERLHRERPPVAQDSAAVLKDIYASKQSKGRGREPWKPITIDLPRAPIRQQRASRTMSHASTVTLPVLLLLAALGWGFYVYQATRPSGNQILTATERPPADARPPVDVVAPQAPPATYTPVASGGTGVSVPYVAGSWILSTHPERSRHAGLTGLRHDYELDLEQNDDQVTGSGRKVSENGRRIGASSQTSILVAGTIHGDRLTLAFTERGTRRATEGKFVLLLEGSAAMRGRFASTAAQPSGIVEARRLR